MKYTSFARKVLSEEAKESEQGRLVLERTVDQLRQKLDEASTRRSKVRISCCSVVAIVSTAR